MVVRLHRVMNILVSDWNSLQGGRHGPVQRGLVESSIGF